MNVASKLSVERGKKRKVEKIIKKKSIFQIKS
jgi:hypothetical protein